MSTMTDDTLPVTPRATRDEMVMHEIAITADASDAAHEIGKRIPARAGCE